MGEGGGNAYFETSLRKGSGDSWEISLIPGQYVCGTNLNNMILESSKKFFPKQEALLKQVWYVYRQVQICEGGPDVLTPFPLNFWGQGVPRSGDERPGITSIVSQTRHPPQKNPGSTHL